MRIKWSQRGQSATAILLLIVGSIAATKSLARCPMEIALQWTVEHPDSLPRTLAEITKFPDAYQRVIINRIPVKARAEIWRAHFAEYYSGSVLNFDQRSFLHSIDDSLDNWLKHPDLAKRALANDAPMVRRMKATFGDSLSYVLFGSLGRSGRGSISMQTASLFSATDALVSLPALKNGLRRVLGSSSSVILRGFSDQECNCSTRSNWCAQGCWGSYPCETSSIGCGSFLVFECDGFCVTGTT